MIHIIRLFKQLAKLLLLLSIGAIVIVVFQLVKFQYEEVTPPADNDIFLINPGSSIKSIAQNLTERKIIDDPWLFILLARIKGVDTRVRAGEYQILPGKTAEQLLETFTRGSSIQYSLTVIEGWTFRQMLSALAEDPVIVQTLQGKSDAAIMSQLGLAEQHPEGMFFPDTYQFPRGTTDLAFLKRAYRSMDTHLQREWAGRDGGLPLNSAYEALILASIIEKETGVAYERPLIAGVFVQRLRRKMRLQTDPTIIYGLGADFDGDIRYRDLRKNTPYNTYLHHGLTPTPIALPSLDAIHSAVHPADTNALYFVAKGDGSHQFSATLKEHNNAVNLYQKHK